MAFGKRHIPKHLIIYDNYPSERNRKTGWRWIVLSIVILTSSMLLALQVRAEPIYTQTAQPQTDQAHAGTLSFKSQGGVRMAAQHVSTHVDAEINGLLAKVTYIQTFKNNSDHLKHGVYEFPLPENAGVSYMEMKIGDRVIIGEIKEKQQAKRIYQQALRSGKRAALTEQSRPNMFTQKIANINAQEEVTITLHYLHTIAFEHALFEWRLPTTITPRYTPSEHHANDRDFDSTPAHVSVNEFGWAPSVIVTQYTENNITPPMQYIPNQVGNTFTLNVQLNAGLPLSNINALYHDVNITKQTHHTITLANGYDEMNRDFVLQWSPIKSKLPSAALFTENIDDEFYSLLMVIPPSSKQHELARDIVFIIDTSGSMQGGSINQAKQSLIMALQQLSHKDRFNVIEFNSQHDHLFNDVSPATPDTIQRAITWVNSLNAEGGTEMLPALNAAFDQMPNEERLQQIVFITDGAVGNERALFKLIHTRLDNSRLFTVGIGSAPNSYFMRKAAEFGRGDFNHIGHINDIHQTMTSLFNKLNSAVSTNINIDWHQDAEQYPQRIGELYAGEPLLVTAKTPYRASMIDISGQLDSRTWRQNIQVPKDNQHAGIGSLWARKKIHHVEDQHTTGRLNKTDTKNTIIDIALTHKLVSRFTSFVAVERDSHQGHDQRVKTPATSNPIAKSHHTQRIMLPQTATTGEIAWWLGLFGFISFVIIYRMKEDER